MIALCFLAIPIVGPPLAAITGICTIVVGSFMFFTDKNTPTPPTPPREDVTVIEYNENQQKEKGVPTKNITKK
ncbi:hypothetical protein C6B37_01935 [Candidatus Phytoplasma phoenicium]|uniref:Uncharacterized protein n=1 Tax=Candidatus Phytoplasma phoenicium TaxID=198422 RepID=A0A2S8NTS8_9MOLU|nr:hypothetical protein C6B37_01935 [Candidatus Phytoplasma phoenicium]